jgi:glycosyltransferase involved in cell wall biosynthesis
MEFVRRIKQAVEVIQSDGFPALFHRINAKFKIEFQGFTRSDNQIYYQDRDLPYRRWIEWREPGPEDIREQRLIQDEFSYRPVISIITPVYDPDVDVLRLTISSVLEQTYSNWELCLVDGASKNSAVCEVLEYFSNLDNRIKVHRLERNLGISGNTNVALGNSRGDYVAFLDHDDELALFALYEVVKLLNDDPNLDLIYSDHDLLSYDGTGRCKPLFKPDWSPEIMLSANYITHLTVVRKSLISEVGGLEPGLDGAQDWDLFFRISEKSDRIAHIPKILYHWREGTDSTATDIRGKPYAIPAQLKAIDNHLGRKGLKEAKAYFDRSGYIRVSWKFMAGRKVSIIIPSKGSSKMLETCVDSILSRTKYEPYEIIIVNNGNRLPHEFRYYDKMSRLRNITVVHYPGEFNYSKVNNYGVEFASGELLLFLNNDIQVIDDDWMNELCLWADREDVGAVGAKLLSPNGRIQHAGVIVGLSGFAGHIFSGLPEFKWSEFGLAEWYRNYSAVTAACLLVRKDVFEDIGRFNEEFLLCGNDVEFCLRIWEYGLRVVYNPFARLVHLEGATREGEIPDRDFEVSYRYYSPLLERGDPYFNPNLSYWNLKPTRVGQNELDPLTFASQYLETRGENKLRVNK